jgi:hypothetical protein
LIGHLYNYSAWPNYLSVKPETEVQWINSCRIVRITQEIARIPNVVPDSEAKRKSSPACVNAALTLSAMRRLMMDEMSLPIPDVGQPEIIPPLEARILLGGSLDRYSGFLPGLLEEALVTLQQKKPLFILGGFGGAAEVLARAVIVPGGEKRDESNIVWQQKKTPALATC